MSGEYNERILVEARERFERVESCERPHDATMSKVWNLARHLAEEGYIVRKELEEHREDGEFITPYTTMDRITDVFFEKVEALLQEEGESEGKPFDSYGDVAKGMRVRTTRPENGVPAGVTGTILFPDTDGIPAVRFDNPEWNNANANREGETNYEYVRLEALERIDHE